MLIKKAYAKINLTLDIVGRREDGYHLIESVMQSISLEDTVRAEKADGISVECDAEGVPSGEGNIAHKAAKMFFEYTGINGGVRIVIDKNIPSEAGLGGGSADAAASLCLLNELYDAKLSSYKLEKIAARVGADVPFCIRGGATICRGIGDEIKPIRRLPTRKVVLIKPDFGVSTPEAYRRFDIEGLESTHGTKEFMAAQEQGRSPYKFMSNDLETALSNVEILKIKSDLLALNAEGAQMTGSGSCVFGLFKDELEALNAMTQLDGKYPYVMLCTTI